MPSNDRERRDREAELASNLSAVNDRMQRKLLTYGNPPDVDRIPESVWTEFRQEVQEAVARTAIVAYLYALATMPEATGVAIDSARFEVEAELWSKNQASKVADEYVAHTRQRLAEIVPEVRAVQAGPAADIRRHPSFDAMLGPTRAETVASTEVTNGFSHGETDYADSATQQLDEPFVMMGFWVTERDARVCPICAPLDMLPQPRYAVLFPKGPPAHPRCRCWLRWMKIRRDEIPF